MATTERVAPPPGPGRAGAGAPADDDASIRRLVLGLAWPVIVEQLLQTAVGVVDLLMVSRLGAAAIAGVGVSVQVLFVIFAGIAAIATGTTVLIARFVGSGAKADAARVVKQSIVLGVLLGVFLAVVGIPLAKPLVAALGAAPDVVEAGGVYLQIVFLSGIPLTLAFVLGAAMRGAGDSRTPMLVAVGINVINVVVALVLIFGLLGFPALGVAGSAWGAAAGRLAGTVAMLVLLARGVGNGSLRLGDDPGRRGWLPDPPLVTRLARIGLPSMGEQLSRSLGMLLFSTIVISLGTAVFAAQRITFNILSLSFLPGFGFAMAATALTGQALGAGLPDRARRATWFAVRSAVAWMGTMGVLFFVAAPLFMRVFTDDPEIVTVGEHALRVLAFGQPQVAVAQVLAGGLRGAGDTRFPMVTTTVSMWLVRLPVAWFFVTHLGLGLPGAYASFIFGSTLEALAIYLRYRAGAWQRQRV